jgi:hypothetical protein
MDRSLCMLSPTLDRPLHQTYPPYIYMYISTLITSRAPIDRSSPSMPTPDRPLHQKDPPYNITMHLFHTCNCISIYNPRSYQGRGRLVFLAYAIIHLSVTPAVSRKICL